MSPKAMMLNTLENDDYDIIMDYIRILSTVRKKERAMRTIAAMDEFQGIIGDNKGWDSEEDMLKDMAAFRRERLGCQKP